MKRLRPGSVVRPRLLLDLRAREVRIPDPHRVVHLQFRRFSGCPICNLHLRSIAARHDEIVAAGIQEIVVFHTVASEMAPHQALLPFTVVPDPAKRLYAEFGVEASLRAVLDPRVWLTALRSLAHASVRDSLHAAGGRFGLPADFLIASDGRIIAVRYGRHAADQWSVDELLALTHHPADREPV